MDLFSIIRVIWRHKFVATPIVLLTVIGMYYVFAIKPPVYEATSSLLLLNPPAGPTPAQIAAHPKLAKINSNNPYVDLGNLAAVADAVIEVVTSNSGAQALVQAGADPQYEVALSTDYGAPPIIEITGIAPTAQEAIRTANLVAQATTVELRQMQADQGVNNFYMITTSNLVSPHQAQLSVSGKLRTLIAVLGIGAILLFVVISMAEAVAKRRADGSVNDDMGARMDVSRRTMPADKEPAYGPRRGRRDHPEPRPARSARRTALASPTVDPDRLEHLSIPPRAYGSQSRES